MKGRHLRYFDEPISGLWLAKIPRFSLKNGNLYKDCRFLKVSCLGLVENNSIMKQRTVLASLVLLFTFSSFNTVTDNYALDPGHTHIGFDVERFLVGEVSGRFNSFTATLSMEGEDHTTLKANVVIQVNSLDSNNETRDGHLKGAAWLDATTYPEIHFTSTEVYKNETGDGYEMKGNLKIKDHTKEVSFPVEILGPFKDPTGQTTIGVRADFTINRFDYGISFNKKMDNGGFFIGKDVKIKIRALANKK